MRKITEIIVHCTANKATSKITVADIDACHRSRGFRCIGYHYVVMPDGKVEKGRPENETGAHCLGHNACSIGVAYVGGLDSTGKSADTRTPEQRRSLEQLLTSLKKRYPDARIHSHRDFAAKDCPCFDATSEYSHIP